MDINRYRKLEDSLESDKRDIKINTHVPNPTERDYENGYIRRYFVQKRNDKSSPIFEVSLNQFENIDRSPL